MLIAGVRGSTGRNRRDNALGDIGNLSLAGPDGAMKGYPPVKQCQIANM
jgi:hypothetical protein